MPRIKPKLFDDGETDTPTQQEQRVARMMKGKRQRGSGSSMYAKGDVKLEDFLIDCKQTKHASMRITGDMLSKISKEAAGMGKDPMLEIEIQGYKKDQWMEHRWVMVPMSVMQKLIEGES